MKLRKDIDDMTKCAAARCRQAPAGTLDVMGQPVPFCAKHLQEGKAELDPAPAASPAPAAPLASYADIRAEMSTESTEAENALADIEAFQVRTNDDQEFAATLLKETKGNLKRLKEREQAITRPMNKALKEVRDLFRPALQGYAEIETILKRKLIEFTKRAEAENRRALQAAQAAHDAGDMEGVSDSLSALHNTENPNGISVRRTWDFEIEDLSQVPRNFLCLDRSAVKIAIREAAGHITIPGLRIFQKEILAAAAE